MWRMATRLDSADWSQIKKIRIWSWHEIYETIWALKTRSYVLWQRDRQVIISLDVQIFHSVIWGQGSQTRGQRAACGPPRVYVRPSSLSKIEKYSIFKLKFGIFIWQKIGPKIVETRSYLTRYVDHRTCPFKLWPSEHFFLLMRPVYGSKLETPVLRSEESNYIIIIIIKLYK